MAIDGLVSCRRALEIDREPTDQLMDFGRALPQTFRTLIAITTDPSLSRPPHFVPAFTWPFTRLTPSRGQPGLLWSGAQPNKNNDCCDASCVVFMDTMHLHATCAAQPEELLAAQSAIKNGEGLPAAYEGGRKQPHPFHHHPPIRTQDVAPCRRRFIRYFELPESTDEKGRAYPPTTLDCGTTNLRHPRFGQAT
ncbi:hypothetical protein TcBrA4_0138370 [Trypanosoma cruzi]|nr:hypothetical protein TcBrA4_0138370 [Trypanosoma cruzi]